MDDDSGGILALHDILHMLKIDGLEIQNVARVVVRAHGLGVAVVQNALHAQIAQREGGMHATIVKLDSLPNAVGSPADNQHFGS